MIEDVDFFNEFRPKSPVLRNGDRGDAVVLLQRLLVQNGHTLKDDGVFGNRTEKAVLAYQRSVGLVADGIAGEKTLRALYQAKPDDRFLKQSDLVWAAETLGVEVASVMAVSEVESRGRGFLNNGAPVILYERHVMYRQLKSNGIEPDLFVAQYPELVNIRTGGYLGGLREHDRLQQACALHTVSALESASWGAYQIMGFHWKHLGYLSAKNFTDQMRRSERHHLDAFVRFIKKDSRLHKALKARDWARFAYIYNGPAYEKNKYSQKMASAYERHSNNLRGV